ncbi:MAG: hypothetical protein V5A38_05190 [Halolamina sp.]|uniref:hypothetical protein n=1 Tax=Halolamina sp. TaxID=1940283 RepID=UPI002FC3222C
MSLRSTRERLGSVLDTGVALRGAFAELFAQEFSYSAGHLATILNGCLFAPSLLTFWFVNGVLDFSTAVAIGAVATPAGLQLRLFAYLLLLPMFLLARATLHMLHPVHRAQLLAGACPKTRLLSLDWISMGILATGLPLAIQNFGPWFGMNAVFVLGVFVVPRPLPTRRTGTVKLLAIVFGSALFLYANYGSAVHVLPAPSIVLGPIATFSLTDSTTTRLFRLLNSVTTGPLLVGTFGVLMNRFLTRPELTDVPLLRHALPQRDPDLVVATNAAVGTTFYLAVGSIATGQPLLLP